MGFNRIILRECALRPWLMRLMAFCIVIFLCVSCTYKDGVLEKKILKNLKQFKASKQTSLDMSSILGNSWRKLCVQPAYWSKEMFEKSSGENPFFFKENSENEIRFWVFYEDGSISTALLPRTILDFLAYRNKDGISKICTTSNSSQIYAAMHNGETYGFYFKN